MSVPQEVTNLAAQTDLVDRIVTAMEEIMREHQLDTANRIVVSLGAFSTVQNTLVAVISAQNVEMEEDIKVMEDDIKTLQERVAVLEESETNMTDVDVSEPVSPRRPEYWGDVVEEEE